MMIPRAAVEVAAQFEAALDDVTRVVFEDTPFLTKNDAGHESFCHEGVKRKAPRRAPPLPAEPYP
jgi:hypothetical protein